MSLLRQLWLPVVLMAGGFVMGWAAHRDFRPAHVAESSGSAQVTQERAAVQEQRQEARAAASDVKERVVTRVVYRRAPDGSVTRETTSERGTEARAATTERVAAARVEYRDRTVTQVEWRDRVEDAPRALPAWQLTVTGGLGRPTLSPTWRDAVIGVGIGRRILGPVSLGVWTQVPLGAPLRPAVGLSVGVTW